jgi:hypothetical protein
MAPSVRLLGSTKDERGLAPDERADRAQAGANCGHQDEPHPAPTKPVRSAHATTYFLDRNHAASVPMNLTFS